MLVPCTCRGDHGGKEDRGPGSRTGSSMDGQYTRREICHVTSPEPIRMLLVALLVFES